MTRSSTVLLSCFAVLVSLTLSGLAKADPIKIQPISVWASSSYGGRTPDLVTDGNPNTEWNSGGYPPAWIILDLGRPMPIGKIRMLADILPAGTVSMTVAVGSDLASMRNVFFPYVNLSDMQWIEVSGDGSWNDHLGNVRYVKITTNSGPSWVAWREIEVYGGLEYFGYYVDATDGIGDPNNSGDFIPQTTAAGTNLVWIGTSDMPTLASRLAEARQHSAKAIVDLSKICWLAPDYTQLIRDAQGTVCPAFDSVRDTINNNGYQDVVAAFYLNDEPYTRGAAKSDMAALATRIKGDFPSKPTLSIEYAGTMANLDSSYFAMLDWVGFDCYGCGSTALDGYVSQLRGWLSNQQRMIAVPWADRAVGSDISPTAQNPIVGEINYWHQKVLSDAKFVAVVPFLWTDIRENYYGARDMSWVQTRYYQLERSFLPASETRVFPVSYYASGTYNPGSDNSYYPFAAFDGSDADFWNSGGFPTQWIEGVLGGSTHVSKIDLTVGQDIPGSTTHWLYGLTTSGWIVLGPASNPTGPFQGYTKDFQHLVWTGSTDISAIWITTSQGPAWVCWRDIQIYH
jgi:hypothetical protein